MDLRKTVIGIELGSTRIKAVMIDTSFKPIASGDFEWENRIENGIWTYHYDEVVTGLQTCFARLKDDVKRKFGTDLTTTGAIGISAMMHGYIPTDKSWNTLCAFRTWRNTITGEAAEKLTKLFGFNIPQRWCISHLYQAILNNEKHVKDIAHVETLASYVNRLLCGENNIGIDDASGMFPIDSDRLDYNSEMADKFMNLTGFDIRKTFPKVMVAGQVSGKLTKEGALLLDPSGKLEAGIPLAPPEGDAATGMAATDAVRLSTGNVSAGTSDFAMIVTDKKLGVHREIDMVTTPSGAPVAMVH
ncbi:MAG: ATPase, partial [Spirochaetales bacterium]|nr:ATPase [Spirochaetales bacterium]